MNGQFENLVDIPKVVVDALEFAKSAHAGQIRGGNLPYYTHCRSVVEILLECGVEDSAILAAAALHDVLEDTKHTEEELNDIFGPTITSLVVEMTNELHDLPFKDRHLHNNTKTGAMTDSAKMIKLADRLHNISDMDSWPEWRQKRYARTTKDLLKKIRTVPVQVIPLYNEITNQVKQILR